MIQKSVAVYLLILTVASLIPVSTYLATHQASLAQAHAMVPFTSYQELQYFIQGKGCNSSEARSLYGLGSFNGAAVPAGTAATFSVGSASSTPSHSETNAQVAGVDELDTVKNDGQYIYTVTNNTVAIVLAYPVTGARLVARVSVNGFLQGIFVEGNKLAIVSQQPQYAPSPVVITGVAQPTISSGAYPTIYSQLPETTSLYVFDITDHSSPVLKTSLVMNGTFAGARLIGDFVYLVATQTVSCSSELLLPERVVNGHAVVAVPVEVYHSDLADYGNSFTSVVGLNINQNNPNPTAKIFLIGTSSTIYVSLHDLYLTSPIWSRDQETVVHRISIDGGTINYEATGELPGHVLNQFSMDEYNGYFRVATTNYASTGIVGLWSRSLGQQQTNLYVLDKSLHVVGSLEGLSPGEAFYSARFIGDKAYLVTFKRMDPLFVIGLQNPSRPQVLGQLNITGVSDYLQPYDETHLIGFGKSSVDITWENAALFTGLKLSLFNVTDPNHPGEMSKYLIGDRGSDSPALTDHKAVLFDRSQNLLVIPVEIATQTQTPPGACCYWNPYTWQGAYVFNVTLQNGLVFRGGITHLQTGQLPNWTNNGHFVTRALYIGSVLYTISNGIVKMNSLADLSEIGTVNLV